MMNINHLEVMVNDLIKSLPDIEFKKQARKNKSYANIPFTFDIETTSFYEHNLTGEIKTNIDDVPEKNKDDYIKKNIMYAFVFAYFYKDSMVSCIGRTWNEFNAIIDTLIDKYDLSPEKRLIIYVHNLSYEFQYIRMRFAWDKVFALDERKVASATTISGIEFRCSYILSGYSLEKVGENLVKYKVEKMVGDLDYKKLRNSKTILTNTEKQYIYNDAYVVLAYIQELIESTKKGTITALPLTNTGFVRQYIKHNCLCNTKDDKHKNYKYRQIMKKIQIKDSAEYLQLKRAFHGGFTHASNYYSGYTVKNVQSFDFTSSYPACLLMYQYPMTTGKIIKIHDRNHFNSCLKTYCCLFDVEFTNISELVDYEHPISVSKCFLIENYKADNGRLIKADKIRITLTEQDYFIIEKFYKWNDMKVANFRIYRKAYLPDDFIKSMLKLYNDKTSLKGVEGKETEYLHAKGMLNAFYGMCVYDFAKDDIVYDNDSWFTVKKDLDEVIEKYNKSMSRFLAFQWGVWCTSYAMKSLFTGIYACKYDYVYADTDSIKILNYEQHLNYINIYNDDVINKLKKSMAVHDLPFELCKPKDIKGNEHLIGIWSNDGFYTTFKTLGAKRYLSVDAEKNELHLTVSGINKKTCIPYLKETYKTYAAIFDAFKDDLVVPKGKTGKNIHTYLDFEQQGILTDYNGVSAKYNEYSSVHMEETSYHLTLSGDYLDYLLGYKKIKR